MSLRRSTSIFPIYQLADDANAEFSTEQMGTRSKFWFMREDGPWLFKHSRNPKNGHPSGEHWAEVVAAALADKLGIPHAEYELACFKGTHGVATRRFVAPNESLIHGNELLTALDPRYPKQGSSSYRRCRRHTIDAVRDALCTHRIAAPKSPNSSWYAMNALQVFEGYLLLDAWIGNTDRHHENWGVCASTGSGPIATLAPTYDHASSLGANLTESDRDVRLNTRDDNRTVDRYAAKARSRFWPHKGGRALPIIEALRSWRSVSPTDEWLERLDRITDSEIEEILNRVPPTIVSEPARLFAAMMLKSNKSRIMREV